MASTLFRGPILQGKKNEAGLSGYNIEQKDSNYTVVIANGDSGKTFLSNTKDVVFTLPAIAVGNVYTFINTGADGQNNLTISPNADDGILYLGGLEDDKDLKIFRKITNRYDTKDFVIITYKQNENLFSENSFKNIKRIVSAIPKAAIPK